MNGLQRMSKARVQLLTEQPWFGSLAMRLKIEADPNLETMDTDGSSLRFNEEWVSLQTESDLKTVVAHEVVHCALLHPFRRGTRDAKRWNRACDFSVNQELVDAGFRLPDGALIDPKYKGLAAEVIYAQLRKEDEGKQQGQGNEPSPAGTFSDAPEDAGDGDGADKQGMGADDWKIAAEQASNVTRKAGKLPGGASRAAKRAQGSPEDWIAILREFIEQTAPSDYSWGRPNRRHIANGLYLPSVVKENLGRIGVAVDTSGSIDQHALDCFSREVEAIAREARPSGIEVVYCDTRIRKVDLLDCEDDLQLSGGGGGGTYFGPVFEHFDGQDEPPVCVLYFTDLENYGEDELKVPSYPVLWATGMHNTIEPPFGQVVRIDW